MTHIVDSMNLVNSTTSNEQSQEYIDAIKAQELARIQHETVRLREFSLSLVAEKLDNTPISDVLKDAEQLFQYLTQDLQLPSLKQ